MSNDKTQNEQETQEKEEVHQSETVENPPAIPPENLPEKTPIVPHLDSPEDWEDPHEVQIRIIDQVIATAKKMPAYYDAMISMKNYIIKSCFAGDFVSHDSEDKPLEMRTANPIGAACERIANMAGVSEYDRSNLMKETYPDGHYRYTIKGKFRWAGRIVEAMGQATTRNPFYSKSHGKAVPVAEIREDYIRTNCVRDLTKQGIKAMFGLNKIPMTKLQELGYDISKVRVVSFKSKEGSQAAKNPQATAPVKSVKWMAFESFEERSYGDKKYVVFKTTNGNEVSCWHTGEILSTLKNSIGAVQVKAELIQKGKYWNINKVLETGAL